MLAGTFGAPFACCQPWLIKLAPDGSVQWQVTYDSPGLAGANNIVPTRDGGYVLSGEGTEFMVVKLDAIGNVQWAKNLGDGGYTNLRVLEPLVEVITRCGVQGVREPGRGRGDDRVGARAPERLLPRHLRPPAADQDRGGTAGRRLQEIVHAPRLPGLGRYGQPVAGRRRADLGRTAAALDVPGQMVASTLSKKIAAGSSHLVLDIPIGPTAKVRSMPEAQCLRRLFEYVARHLKLTLDVVITDGRQPVGHGIGPVLEARDVMRVLECDPRAPIDLRQKALRLAGRLIECDPDVRGGDGFDASAANRPRVRTADPPTPDTPYRRSFDTSR